VAGELAKLHGQDGRRVVGVRVAGPNAGHVVVDKGERWAMRQIPVAFINPDAELYIAAGSEIDPAVLLDELDQLEGAGYDIQGRLKISPQATILEPRHIQAEQESDIVSRLGSTAKGVGAARADRIWRTATIAGTYAESWKRTYGLVIKEVELNEPLNRRDHLSVVIEGTQGYGLGLHAGLYPQCTSSDCRAIDFLAMAGISPWALKVFGPHDDRFQIHVVTRPNPIRVAGNSGPMLDETSWANLGLEEERTTVTKKIRRVGGWDSEIVRQAVIANGIEHVGIAFAMADHVLPQVKGMTTESELRSLSAESYGEVVGWLDMIARETGADVTSMGTGPDSTVWL
jgi:adenylosuccinate synthase